MATERLKVILEMVAGQYKREAREAATATGTISKQAGAASTATGGLQRQVGGLGSVMRSAAVLGGITAVGRGLFTAVEAAERSSSALAVTEQVIEKTGGVANVTAGDIENLTRRLSGMTGVQDELIQEGANVLLTFRNIRNEVGEGNDVFDRTAELMLDISTVMNTDAAGAATQLGKALNDPIAGMSALSRAGLTFDEQQKDQIRTLVASGDTLEAQKLILTELETQLGGTAAASADASDKISNSVGEIGESVGTFLLPFLEAAATELQTMVGLADDLDRVAAHAGGAAESAEAFLTVVQTKTGAGGGFLNDVGSAIEGVVVGLVPGISRMERFREELEELAPRLSVLELQRARDGLEAMGEEMGLTRSEIELVAEVLDAELSQAAAESADEVLRLKDNTADAGDAAGDAAGETGSYVRELRNLRLAQLELLNPALGAINALGRYKQALVDSKEAIAEYGSESEEAEEAGLNLLESYSALIGEAQNYANVAGVSLNDAIRNLGTDAGLTEDQIQFLIDSLVELDRLTIDDKTFTVRAITETVTVGGRRVEPGDVAVVSGGTIRSHSGGPYQPGERHLIKPDEEIFVSDNSGQFLLNDQVMNALRGLNGGRSTTNHWNIPIQSSGDANTDAQLVGAVASVLRRMESL